MTGLLSYGNHLLCNQKRILRCKNQLIESILILATVKEPIEFGEERIKSLYNSLINDSDFDRLELGFSAPNIFSVLKVSRNEIRHSNFLAWLLNPKGSHGIGDLVLKRFLREVFSSNKFSDVDQIEVEGLETTKAEILREWNHIDLLIVLDNIVVCLENKVFSKEHSNQLERYKTVLDSTFPGKRKVYVYLNPEGDEPQEENDSYQPLSYEFLVETLQRIIDIYGGSIKPQVLTYLKDYISTIKRDIMGSDKLVDLAKRIYKNHKELLDFIFEAKPDLTQEIHDILIEVIKSKGYTIGSENKFLIRFLHPKVDPLVYRNKTVKNGWKLGESFSHEILIGTKVNKLTYKPVIAPADPEYNSEGLLSLLMEIEGFRQPYGKKWLVPFLKIEKVDYDGFESLTYEERREKLEKAVDKFLPHIQKVDNKLLGHQQQLQSWL